MIHLEKVSLFTPAGKKILNNITWSIREGENWVVFGRNGSGKTRLLDIVAGYLYPSSGTVTRFSQGQGDADLRELRKRIGFTSSTLKEKIPRGEKTLDVVLSGLSASIGLYENISSAETAYAIKQLAMIGLPGRDNDFFHILSDGEKQKVLLARAMINDPALLIMDEPVMGLDLRAREDLFDAMKKLNTLSETSLVFVTHYPEEIIPIFKKILMINDGHVFFQGYVDQGMTQENLSRIFEAETEISLINDRYYCRISSSL